MRAGKAWDLSRRARYVARTILGCQHLPGFSGTAQSPHPIFVCREDGSIPGQYKYDSSYINPSMAQDAIRAPSWLKVTEVTGSECAGRVLIGRAVLAEVSLYIKPIQEAAANL